MDDIHIPEIEKQAQTDLVQNSHKMFEVNKNAVSYHLMPKIEAISLR